MKLTGKNIVITSNEPWGDTWYSKQNYAWELSQRGNRVYFIDPPMNWQVSGLVKSGITEKAIAPGLTVLGYSNALPIRSRSLYRKNNRIVSRRLRRYFANKGITDLVFWSFDPYRLSDPAALGAAFSIFHSVDEYGFAPYGEKELATRSDLVIAVADPIAAPYRSLNKNVITVAHAIGTAEFLRETSDAVKRELPEGPFGIYVGNIDERMDFGLVEELLLAEPGTSFVFIGNILALPGDSAKRIFAEKKYANALILGSRPFRMLRHYVSAASFCLAPMNRQHRGNTISHHKILQYLALGKPVFSCRFSAYEKYQDLFWMSDDPAEVKALLHRFLREGEAPSLREQRIARARDNSFDNQFARIEHAIAALSPVS